MTDDEARSMLYEMRHQPSPRMAQVVRHALQAIEDRVVLVEVIDADFETVADVHKHVYGAISVARRHMQGEP